MAAAQTDPVVSPTPDTTKSPPGPNWIQIGTEGGFLPPRSSSRPQPTTWITDPTRFDVGNVDQHSLLLAPAERADVVVDFSQYRGKTLILYNDAPAAFPARVPGYDYYTGGPDLTPSGAPTTLPGYGPNTRTVMQVKVSNAAPAVAFDRPNTTADRMGALNAAFAHHWTPTAIRPVCSNPGRTRSSSARPPTTRPTERTSPPAAGATPRPRQRQLRRVRAHQQRIQPTDIRVQHPRRADGQDANTLPTQGHARRDELRQLRRMGRMTANLGLEAPGATPLTAEHHPVSVRQPARPRSWTPPGMPSSLDVTPISSAADGTQIWKITHNGVDTHPIHFHLYDVQVINRVTWDNIIIPPDPTELGWKDTVRVSPLEDTIVAVRPIVPDASVRDPRQPSVCSTR